MPIRLGHFEKPDKLNKSEDSKNTYARYAAEPFETGFGHTIGNSLRRVLLSSLEGAAITSVRIEGADHEFAARSGVLHRGRSNERRSALRVSGWHAPCGGWWRDRSRRRRDNISGPLFVDGTAAVRPPSGRSAYAYAGEFDP